MRTGLSSDVFRLVRPSGSMARSYVPRRDRSRRSLRSKKWPLSR